MKRFTMEEYYQFLKDKGLSPEQDELISREFEFKQVHHQLPVETEIPGFTGLYDLGDFHIFPGFFKPKSEPGIKLQTLDDLMERDKKREADGFPRRIRLGKVVKPVHGNKNIIIVVPSTTEPKFYHDNSITEDNEEETGGSGDGDEGEVIGEQQADSQQGEGDGSGPGQGDGENHEIGTDVFDLGKIITEKFHLPNLKDKGKKRAFAKYTYDLTDKNRGFGQVLDKKATLRKVIETNILLGNIKEGEDFNPEDLLINPPDNIYRILSREKDYETQAVVFFLRDYSGSMQGKPTEVVCTQHLLIYSWLTYQYQQNVIPRFILHDTQAKEVPDFYTYYRSQVAGGTNIHPAFELVNKIIEAEHLAKDYNIYVFYGTDGDDWDEDGKETIAAIKRLFLNVNRTGITIAKNAWSISSDTTFEKYLLRANILKEQPELIRMDVLQSENADENRLIEGIRKLVS